MKSLVEVTGVPARPGSRAPAASATLVSRVGCLLRDAPGCACGLISDPAPARRARTAERSPRASGPRRANSDTVYSLYMRRDQGCNISVHSDSP